MLVYGKGYRSLAVDMKMDEDTAKEFIDKYFERFAGVKRWLDETRESVEKKKYVELLTGRIRRLPGVDSNDKGIRADCFRQAVNAPVQGSGAEMTMRSIVMINEEMKKRNLKSKLAITVHDSIVCDVYVQEFEEVFWLMKDIMENPGFDWINVPVVAEAEIGRDYGTLVGIEDPTKDLEGYDTIFDFIDKNVQKKHDKNLAKANESKKPA